MRWSATWTGEVNDQPFFPADGSGGDFTRFVSDPAPLSTLTGTGDVTVFTILNLSESTIQPLAGPTGTVSPLDPNLVSINWEFFDCDVEIQYVFASVPEPAGISLMCIAGAFWLCRSRRV